MKGLKVQMNDWADYYEELSPAEKAGSLGGYYVWVVASFLLGLVWVALHSFVVTLEYWVNKLLRGLAWVKRWLEQE